MVAQVSAAVDPSSLYKGVYCVEECLCRGVPVELGDVFYPSRGYLFAAGFIIEFEHAIGKFARFVGTKIQRSVTTDFVKYRQIADHCWYSEFQCFRER